MLELAVPGDKSIAHRALLCAALAGGESRITGLPDGDDVRRTSEAARVLETTPRGAETIIDCGSSGTTLRLLTGLLAAQPGTYHLHVSAQLARRPMAHVVTALRAFGAHITLHECPSGGRRVSIVEQSLQGASIRCEIPSAQLKSALILAALQARGGSRIHAPVATRDHLERLLPLFGGCITRAYDTLIVTPHPLHPADVQIPGDVSAAAPWIVATLLFRNEPVCINHVGLNPTRLGLIAALQQMGARIETTIRDWYGEEPVGQLTIWPSTGLRPLTLHAAALPTCIDELPLLALAAGYAQGTSRFFGVELLRSKECDRLQAIVELLTQSAIQIEVKADVLIVHGPGEVCCPDAILPTHDDHRIAMLGALIILAQRGRRRIGLDQPFVVEKSYPRFWRDFAGVFPHHGFEAFDNPRER